MATAEQLKALIRAHFDDDSENLRRWHFRLQLMKLKLVIRAVQGRLRVWFRMPRTLRKR